MKNSKLFLIFMLLFICLLGGCSKNETTTYTLTGYVTDVTTGYPIPEVAVLLRLTDTYRIMPDIATSTGYEGGYQIEELKTGNYTITFSKSGYKTVETKLSINQSLVFNYQLEPIDGYTPSVTGATVTIVSSLAISNGIYLYFNPSANTKKYYWNFYESSILTGHSDEEIMEDVIEYGIDMDMTGLQEGYTWDFTPNTSYTFGIVAYDAQGKAGALVKKTIATKPSANQPIAAVTLNSIGNTNVWYDARRNSSCSTYALTGWFNMEDHIDDPDILWAYRCYESYKEGDKYSSDIINSNWENFAYNSICVIASLGFNSQGVNSGVIDKRIFRTGPNSTILRNGDSVRSLQYQMPKKAKMDKAKLEKLNKKQ